MKKPSAYQKLKEEKERLEDAIRILVFEPDSPTAIGIKLIYKMKRDIENAVMAGNIHEQDKTK